MSSSATKWLFPEVEQGIIVPSEDSTDLKGKHIGIDGDFLVELILARIHACNESPWVVSLGDGMFTPQAVENLNKLDIAWMLSEGLPPTIFAHLESVLLELQAAGVAGATIVFDGIPTTKIDRSLCFAPLARQPQSWATTFSPKSNVDGQDDEIKRVLQQSAKEVLSLDPMGLAAVKRYLSHLASASGRVTIASSPSASLRGFAEVITAPTLAWAQLAAMVHNGQVQQIVAPFEALFFVDILPIVNIGSTNGTIKTKTIAMNKSTPQRVASFNSAASSTGRWKRRVSVPPDGSPLNAEAMAILPHAPVFDMKRQTVCQLTEVMNKPPIFKNLRSVYHRNLLSPDGCGLVTYYMLLIGALDTSCMSVVAHDVFQDAHPIITTEGYETLCKTVMPLRAQIIYQLLQNFDPNGTHESLKWRKSENGRSVDVPITRPPPIKLDHWNLNARLEPLVTPVMISPGSSTRLHDAPHSLSSVAWNFNSCGCGDIVHPVLFDTPQDVLAVTLLKALDLLGYFTHSSQAEGESSAASAYADALQFLSKFPEEGVLLIELSRTRALHDRSIVENISGKSSHANPSLLLALRILSFFHCNLTEPYNGAVNLALTTFVLQIRYFQQNLRVLCEVVLHNLIASGRAAKIGPSGIQQVARWLPFGNPLSSMAAVISNCVLHTVKADGLLPDMKRIASRLKSEVPHVTVKILKEMLEFWKGAFLTLSELEKVADVTFENPDVLKNADRHVDRAFTFMIKAMESMEQQQQQQ